MGARSMLPSEDRLPFPDETRAGRNRVLCTSNSLKWRGCPCPHPGCVRHDLTGDAEAIRFRIPGRATTTSGGSLCCPVDSNAKTPSNFSRVKITPAKLNAEPFKQPGCDRAIMLDDIK